MSKFIMKFINNSKWLTKANILKSYKEKIKTWSSDFSLKEFNKTRQYTSKTFIAYSFYFSIKVNNNIKI